MPAFGNFDPNNVVIGQNRVRNIDHEVYLNDDQIEMQRILSKPELQKRQFEIVRENGLDVTEDIESDIERQKARYMQ